MANTALITGASSGIGEELARVHAQAGGDLIIVARRRQRLEQLAEELTDAYGVAVHVMAADLAKPRAAQKLFTEIEARELEVDVLINNAGFGAFGAFHESELLREQGMMQVNMVALTELTYLLVQGMVQRGNGKILNVGSVAGFFPGPLQAVYFASKAYVNSFSQALAAELKGTGVTVTVLCPGPVATEFQETSDMQHVKGFEFAASGESVARRGYKAMNRGELVAFNDPKMRVLMDGVLPFLPRKGVLSIARMTMQKGR